MTSHKHAWERITSDPYILHVVNGLELEFEEGVPPAQIRVPLPYKLNSSELKSVDDELSRLQEKGVIEHAMPEEGQFISNIFVREKKDGAHRIILDLSKLNEHIAYHHFKMDTFDTAVQLITPGCYMASIDLRDAYYTVPIAESHRKYLRFMWKGSLWQFKAMPNGLASAPRIFTKLLKPVFAAMRAKGHTIVAYIDDTLIIAKSKELAEKAVIETAQLLSEIGFVIHPKKSVLMPLQNIQFLGFVLDSNAMKISLAEGKAIQIKSLCYALLRAHAPTIRTVASVIGKLVAAFPAVHYGQMHYRQLEREKTMALRQSKGHYDRKMSLSMAAKAELMWWVQNIDSCCGSISQAPPSVMITSDASGLGWGASDGNTHIGGRWNETERVRAELNDINFLELLAAFYALQAFCTHLAHLHVHMRLDNTTAVAYINHKGGIKSRDCDELAKRIWEWCKKREIWITATHLPGVQNQIADEKSRKFNDQLEWMLNRDVFRQLCGYYGNPEVDLFATRLNAQVDKYVSWLPDPGGCAVDAFSIDWQGDYFYAFPPFCLIGRCLQKIEAEKAEGFMIVPNWPTQAWFGRLLNLLIDEPIILPVSKTLVTQPVSGVSHPLYKRLHLMSCRLSGNTFKVQAFQMKLPRSSCLPGVSQPTSSIQSTQGSGWIFAIGDRLIRCKRL